MVESPSSPTSDEPQIERVGLIHDKAPFDPITTDLGDKIQPSGSSRTAPDAGNPDTEAEGWLEENATIHEEVELEDSIRRELLQLAIVQAEIEAVHERLGAVHDEEEGKDVEAEKKENIDEGNHKVENNVEEENESHEIGQDTQFVKSENGTFAESLMEENENERGGEEDERNVEGLWGEEVMKIERDNHNNNRRKNNYPTRPDAEDCAYYMRFGSCKFGLNCKFNHPPGRKNQVKDKAKHREENSERIGQAECRYYLTSGGCRYGKDCKYSHASDKSSSSHNQEFNFLGLPIRPGEKECPFYMRTGSCKYGPNCRFHHPDPKAVAASGSPSGYGNGGSLSSQPISSLSVSSRSLPRVFTDTSPFAAVMFPPTQGGATPNSEWNGYQAVAYTTSERRSLPTPPVFAMNNLSTEINFPVQSLHGMIVEEYPERPGEPECSFFLKTGDCKFKSNCKFHHPKNRCSNTKLNLFALNDKGLPLRPDQPICTYYHRYGICKYGPSCKYDHPSNFGIVPSPDLLPFGNSKIVNGSETSGFGNETKPSV